MTKEELKKKIVEVVNQWHMFQNRDMNGNTIWLTNDSEKLADALIDAGIGDVETTRKICARATAMAVLQAAKAEHRAERAEMALKNACINVIKDEEDDIAVEPRANVLYKAYLRQAEKELAEGKEENNAKNQRE